MTTTSAEIAGTAVHKVAPPPPQSTASKMKSRVKETFFPDDPFRAFKGQPLGTQWLMAVMYLFPILDWAPGYSFSLFKSDLISGLTIASLAIPQARMHLLPASSISLSLHPSHQNRFLSIPSLELLGSFHTTHKRIDIMALPLSCVHS